MRHTSYPTLSAPLALTRPSHSPPSLPPFLHRSLTYLFFTYFLTNILPDPAAASDGEAGQEQEQEAEEEEEETVLPPGTIIGFAESLLPAHPPLKHSFTAASFVHLLYFDRAAVLAEAERRPQLLRSLWWFAAAQVYR